MSVIDETTYYDYIWNENTGKYDIVEVVRTMLSTNVKLDYHAAIRYCRDKNNVA